MGRSADGLIGHTVGEIIPMLKRGIAALGTEASINTTDPTPLTAGNALLEMLVVAAQRQPHSNISEI